MKIFDINTIENVQLYPYFYFKEYVSFIRNVEKKDVIFFEDKFGNTVACKMWINKFLKLIQLTYPPLNKDGENLDKSQEDNFLNEWILFIKSNGMAHRIVQPENFAIFKSTPKYSIYAPFGTYYINLEKYTEVELFANLHSKNRNVIKNAERKSVFLKYGKECINDFYDLYKETMKRSNMFYQDISFFMDFYSNLNPYVICGVAYYEGIAQGALFIPYTKFGAFYLYGASKEKMETTGAVNYLHWDTMKFLKRIGVKRYDFVGARLSDVSKTKLEGIQKFKRRFGAELEKGYLWKMDLSKRECNFYDLLLNVKMKIGGKKAFLDIIDQENRKLYAD